MNEIIPLLKNNFLTKNLGDAEISKLAESMKPKIFKKGDLLIKYGDDGKDYFILAKGSVKVFVYKLGTRPDDPQIDENIVFSKIMQQGQGFGELALLYNDKRSATIIA